MNWGFPLIMTGRNGQKLKPKPVTNARDDKLNTAFWRASFESRRCLIPSRPGPSRKVKRGR
jgi:putative SOS response-associated peptidase YedK